MAFTFQRDAVDPKYAMLAQFFANMGNQQRQDAANRDAAAYDEQERKRKEAQALVSMAIQAGDFATADSVAREAGLMQAPNGGYEGMGERLGQRQSAEAAAAAEAKRLADEQGANELSALVTGNRELGTMTDHSAGVPGLVAPRKNVWETDTTLSPQRALALAAVKHKLSAEQIDAMGGGNLSDADFMQKLRTGAGAAQTADQAADTAVASRNAAVGERGASLNERKFGYEQKQDAKKEAAALLKEAAGAGLPPDQYSNLSELLNKARATIEKEVDAVAGGEAIKQAMKSGDAITSNAAIIVFLKALDDSVAREGEVKNLAASMGTKLQYKQAISAAMSGKSDPEYAATLERMIDLVNEKNRGLIDQRLAGFDIQAEAAGPGAQDYYNRWRATVRGSSSGESPKPDGAGSPKPGRRLDPSKRINTGTNQ